MVIQAQEVPVAMAGKAECVSSTAAHQQELIQMIQRTLALQVQRRLQPLALPHGLAPVVLLLSL